jgi:hypothetical protein
MPMISVPLLFAAVTAQSPSGRACPPRPAATGRPHSAAAGPPRPADAGAARGLPPAFPGAVDLYSLRARRRLAALLRLRLLEMRKADLERVTRALERRLEGIEGPTPPTEGS